MRCLVLLLLATSALAQVHGNRPYRVQSYTDPAFSTIGNLTFQNSVTSGNVEFVCIAMDKGVGGGAGGPYTVSSTRVSSWNTDNVVKHYTAPGVRHAFDEQCFHGTVATSGTETITASAGGAYVEYAGEEIANIVDTVDVSGSNLVNSSGPTSIAVALTPTLDGDYIIAGSASSNGQGAFDCSWVSSPSELSTWNSEAIPYNFGLVLQTNFVNPKGSFTSTRNNQGCSSSDSPSDGLTMIAYAFKAVSSGVKVTTTLMPNCDTVHAYKATLEAVGGTGTKTWSVTVGALPTGLSLSSGGVITGTCSASTGSFTVQVQDSVSLATATQVLNITIVPPYTAPTVSHVGTTVSDGAGFVDVGTVAAGDTILVLAQGFDSHGAGGWVQPVSGGSNYITDTFGNLYYRTCPGSDGGVAPMVGYSARTTTGGPLTVSFANTVSASNITWFVLDIHGGSYLIDCGVQVTGGVIGGSSVTLNASITTPVDNELLVAFESGQVPSSDAWSGSSFSKISSYTFGTANGYGAIATSTTTTAGSYSVQDILTLPANSNHEAGLILLGIRPDSASGPLAILEPKRRQVF